MLHTVNPHDLEPVDPVVLFPDADGLPPELRPLAARIGLPAPDRWMPTRQPGREDVDLSIHEIGLGCGYDEDITQRKEFETWERLAVAKPAAFEDVKDFLSSRFPGDHDFDDIREEMLAPGTLAILSRHPSGMIHALFWVLREVSLDVDEGRTGVAYRVIAKKYYADDDGSDVAASVFGMFGRQYRADIRTLAESLRLAGFKGEIEIALEDELADGDAWLDRAFEVMEGMRDVVEETGELAHGAPTLREVDGWY